MKMCLHMPPWGTVEPTMELMEAISLMGDNVIGQAFSEYDQETEERKAEGKGPRPGKQSCVNKVLKEKFQNAGWDCGSSYFKKNGTWIRVSFRHYQTIGSDILEAMHQCINCDAKLAVIAVGNQASLPKLSKSQASSMANYEKLKEELDRTCGLTDIPLMLGELIF